MACITICLAKHVNQSPANSSRNIRRENSQIASDMRFVHQILQKSFFSRAKGATIVVLWNSMPRTNLSAWMHNLNEWVRTRKQTYVEIELPGKDVVIPSLNIACGEKPLVEPEEWLKDAPQNLVDCWVTAIIAAYRFHLAKRQHVGKDTPSWQWDRKISIHTLRHMISNRMSSFLHQGLGTDRVRYQPREPQAGYRPFW